MSSPGFRSDAAAAATAASAAEGLAPGLPGERPLMPVTEFRCGKPYRASEAVAAGVPGKLQDEGLPSPVGKAAERAEDRRPAGAAVLPQGQATACPTSLLLAQSFSSAASVSPSGSQLPTVGTLQNPSQPEQDGAQEVGSETESLPLTGTLLFKLETSHIQVESDQIKEKKTENLNTFKRKAKLKELIEQCPNEEFMELVIPRLTTVVTVFEFLLMKAKKKCRTKAVFPDVYREFEELHSMVKKMSQDYFNNSELKQQLEIKNHKLAESLGITDSCLEDRNEQLRNVQQRCSARIWKKRI
ncbi:zinc finger protein [Crotalus adamanteus]|uniref:Zinc finger protein n=1 Tax=Crotalus adamanteus TaxID=8729 RepID=A0AAW1C4D5_CROAD